MVIPPQSRAWDDVGSFQQTAGELPFASGGQAHLFSKAPFFWLVLWAAGEASPRYLASHCIG